MEVAVATSCLPHCAWWGSGGRWCCYKDLRTDNLGLVRAGPTYRERGRVAFTALDATLCSASIELSGIKLARLDCQSTAALLYINTYPPIGRGRVPNELSW